VEIDRVRKIRAVSSVAVIVLLLLIATGCAATLIIASRAAGAAVRGSTIKQAFARLALLSTATLGLTLILLVWWAARLLSFLLRPTTRHGPTPYVDAWAVAGKRFKLDDEEAAEEDDDEPQPAEDGPSP